MPPLRQPGWLYLFSVGGVGDPPAPTGDPPGAMVAMTGFEKTVPFRSMPLSVPSGGSPDGTGGSPVLPTLNTYGWLPLRTGAPRCRRLSTCAPRLSDDGPIVTLRVHNNLNSLKAL